MPFYCKQGTSSSGHFPNNSLKSGNNRSLLLIGAKYTSSRIQPPAFEDN